MNLSILVASYYTWHMDKAAKGYERCSSLAGVYASNSNNVGVNPQQYHRCYTFQLMKRLVEKIYPAKAERIVCRYVLPIWENWFDHQKISDFNVVQAVGWSAEHPFNLAEKRGALKVFDSTNGHPQITNAYERREIDIWNPAALPAMPHSTIAQATRDLERADLVLCPSKWVKNSMVENGIPEERCMISPFGVDVDLFKPLSAKAARMDFISVGDIRLRKGYQYLFQAFEIVKRKYPQANLICIGPVSPDFKWLEKRWRGLYVHYPYLEHWQLVKMLQQSCAFVFPTIEEGFARVLMEAGAVGVPLISTYESGITTYMDHADIGYLVRTRSVSDLVEAMSSVLSNPSEAQAKGIRARQIFSSHSWENYAEKNISIIREFMKKSKNTNQLRL